MAEEQQITEDDIVRFVNWFANKNRNCIEEYFESVDDCKQEMFLHIYSNVDKYNKENSKGTFLNVLCNTVVLHKIRYVKTMKRGNNLSSVSLSKVIGEDGEELANFIPDKTDYFEKIYAKLEIEKIYPLLNEDSKKHFFKHKSIKEIAHERGTTYEAIRKSIEKNINNIKNILNNQKANKKIVLHQLYNYLTDEEKKYFGDSAKNISKRTGIPVSSIYSHRNKIIKKYNNLIR